MAVDTSKKKLPRMYYANDTDNQTQELGDVSSIDSADPIEDSDYVPNESAMVRLRKKGVPKKKKAE